VAIKFQMVDCDPTFIEAASKRSSSTTLHPEACCADWRDYIRGEQIELQYDAVLCLGNVLGYEDTWPDRDLPAVDPMTSLIEAMTLLRSVLRRDGIAILKYPLNPKPKKVLPISGFIQRLAQVGRVRFVPSG